VSSFSLERRIFGLMKFSLLLHPKKMYFLSYNEIEKESKKEKNKLVGKGLMKKKHEISKLCEMSKTSQTN
jgi:hypothetical protein